MSEQAEAKKKVRMSMPYTGDDPRNLIDHYRESHQMVARMIAADCTDKLIRERTGLSTRRLNMLRNSPLFQELVSIFRQRAIEKFDQNFDVYLDLGMSNMILSEQMIAERLDAAQDDGATPVPLAQLDRIAQGRADRFGYSKHNVVEHKHDFAQLMDRAIERSGKRPEMKQIEGTVAKALPDIVEEAMVVDPPSGTDGPLTPPPEPVATSPTASQRARTFTSVLSGDLRRRKLA
jgi:hypothetical protein